jgi:hypothetical protein
MKPIKIFLCAAAALFIFAVFLSSNSAASKINRDLIGDGFAVLELFTSEGCSSCPPADELMARVQKEAGNKPVYVLAYHVDYWNRNGWKDVFSKAEFSKRQYQYSRWFTGQVYTPQVVVNGKTEFVGSDAEAAQDAVNQALAKPAFVKLNIRGTTAGNNLNISYEIQGRADDAQLLMAVVQKHAVTAVKAGENEGQTLAHAQIVYDLETFVIARGNKGNEKIKLPPNFNTKDWEVVSFLQSNSTGVISTAERVKINVSNSAVQNADIKQVPQSTKL